MLTLKLKNHLTLLFGTFTAAETLSCWMTDFATMIAKTVHNPIVMQMALSIRISVLDSWCVFEIISNTFPHKFIQEIVSNSQTISVLRFSSQCVDFLRVMKLVQRYSTAFYDPLNDCTNHLTTRNYFLRFYCGKLQLNMSDKWLKIYDVFAHCDFTKTFTTSRKRRSLYASLWWEHMPAINIFLQSISRSTDTGDFEFSHFFFFDFSPVLESSNFSLFFDFVPVVETLSLSETDYEHSINMYILPIWGEKKQTCANHFSWNYIENVKAYWNAVMKK